MTSKFTNISTEKLNTHSIFLRASSCLLKPGFDLDLCACYCQFWFFQLRCPILLFVAIRCFSLPVVVLSGFSLLLLSITFFRWNEKCSVWIFVARYCSFWFFWECFHLSLIAFCCSLLLVLVFEIESVLFLK